MDGILTTAVTFAILSRLIQPVVLLRGIDALHELDTGVLKFCPKYGFSSFKLGLNCYS